jgi:hypothetical protein
MTRPWRDAVLEDDQLLAKLTFSISPVVPFRGEHRLPPAALKGYLRCTARYPRLLLRVSPTAALQIWALARLQIWPPATLMGPLLPRAPWPL